jgi:hypothetical protein
VGPVLGGKNNGCTIEYGSFNQVTLIVVSEGCNVGSAGGVGGRDHVWGRHGPHVMFKERQWLK